MLNGLNIVKMLNIVKVSRLNIVKISILPKAIYRFNAISIKIPMHFLQKIHKVLNCIWILKGPQIGKPVSKKDQVEGLCLNVFKTYHKNCN